MRHDRDTHLLVLTGAGISAESGIPTFRDANGLWRQHRFEALASPEGFADDPRLVWEFYSQRRRGLDAVEPNAAHHALVRLERELGDQFFLATQNVDGLHARAGSQRMVEMHGNILRTKCSGCDRPPFADAASHATPPVCDACGGLLRPDVVWFGEALPATAMSSIEAFVEARGARRLAFLAIGTSGVVYPAAGLVRALRSLGAETWLVNAEPSDNADLFDHVELGPAGTVLPRLLGFS